MGKKGRKTVFDVLLETRFNLIPASNFFEPRSHLLSVDRAWRRCEVWAMIEPYSIMQWTCTKLQVSDAYTFNKMWYDLIHIVLTFHNFTCSAALSWLLWTSEHQISFSKRLQPSLEGRMANFVERLLKTSFKKVHFVFYGALPRRWSWRTGEEEEEVRKFHHLGGNNRNLFRPFNHLIKFGLINIFLLMRLSLRYVQPTFAWWFRHPLSLSKKDYGSA